VNTFIKAVREVAGDRIKTLYLPIALSCVDSFLHMGMFSIMVITIIELVGKIFTMQKLILYSGILIVLFVVRAIFYSLNYTRTQFRGADIAADLRLSLGDHIRSLNLGYFNKNSIGRLMSTLTTDIADFEQILTHSLTNIFKVIFFSILALIFAYMVTWQYALIILILIFIALPLMNLSGKMSNKYGGKQKSSVNHVISRIVEYINGIKTFKLYNLIGTHFKRLDDSFVELKKDSIKLELAIMPFSILFSIITSLILPISLIVGTVMLEGGTIDAQRFIAIVMVAVSLSGMMATLGTLYPEMKYLGKAAENILQVRKEKPLSYQKGSTIPKQHGIRFEQVSFFYENDVEVLHGISFEAKPGTTTALVGPSGSGKTTIISLISRFWDVQSGSITIDGTDVKDLQPDDLTSHIAVVFQDVYLLNDTIANNIRVGKPEAEIEELYAAARAAQCHDFIMALPDGYDTLVGEGGSTLSGGEKQRISIARALIKDAPIVLLDETTSNLDTDNEKEINKALDMLMKDKTVMVIAHRLNTIIKADQILVLEHGRIKEHGTHKELLQQNGWYAQMITEQKRARKWVV
jgi:ATP-binding cassette subfamily B protein